MKHPLQKVLEDLGYEVSSYSGRGMYGKTCLGINVDSSDILGKLGKIMADLVRDTPEEFREGVAAGLRRVKTDSMGKGMIVYFPDVEFQDQDNA